MLPNCTAVPELYGLWFPFYHKGCICRVAIPSTYQCVVPDVSLQTVTGLLLISSGTSAERNCSPVILLVLVIEPRRKSSKCFHPLLTARGNTQLLSFHCLHQNKADWLLRKDDRLGKIVLQGSALLIG